MLRPLIKLELSKIFGLNVLNCNKHLNTNSLNKIVFLVLGIFFSIYLAFEVYVFNQIGLSEVVLSILSLMIIILIFAISLFSIGSLYSNQGIELFKTLPIKIEDVAISRIFGKYLESLVLACLIIPSLICYGIINSSSLIYYLFAFSLLLFIPMLPLALSLLLESLIILISSFSNNQKRCQIILTIMLMIVIVVGPMFFNNAINTNVEIDTLIESLIINIKDSYLFIFANDFNIALSKFDLIKALRFIIVSLLITFITLKIISKQFEGIIICLNKNQQAIKFDNNQIKTSSCLKSLYHLDLKCYFASPLYVSNTAISPIIALVLSIVPFFFDINELGMSFNIDIKALAPFVWGLTATLMTICAITITMDAKYIWCYKTLAIKRKDYINSKLLLNLTFLLPSLIISSIVLTFALNFSLSDLIEYLLVGITFVYLVLNLNLASDIKFHNFNYDKEEKAIKQSLSALIGMITNVFVAIVSIAIIFLSGGIIMAKVIICLIYIVIGTIFYIKNIKLDISSL